jgi:primosomal replication protein N
MSLSGQHLNDFRLTARVISKETVRYSPAGQAILECKLAYSGSVEEAGVNRKVELQILAVAIGNGVKALDQMQEGQMGHFQGFIAHQSMKRQALVLHITHISL